MHQRKYGTATQPLRKKLAQTRDSLTTIKLKKVEIKDMLEIDKIVNDLMGNDPSKRKEFIFQNSKFQISDLII